MRDYATAYREFSVAELERRVLGQRLDERDMLHRLAKLRRFSESELG